MEIKDELKASILAALNQAVAEGKITAGEWPDVQFEVPPQKTFGDFATNFAMQAARTIKMNPRLLAQQVVDHLNSPFIERVEIAGPGFINFYLKPDWLTELLTDILRQGDHYGEGKAPVDELIQIEFVSANPTGPLHIGHGRGAAVGSALANLMRAAGYRVKTEYYINDAGNQIDNLAASVNARYLELLGIETDFPENGYHGADIIDTAKRIVKRWGETYLKMSDTDRLAVFKELALKEKLAAVREDLEAFRVTFDEWFSERTLHEAGAIKAACDKLMAQDDMYEQDGAFWLRSSAYGDDKDRVVIRDNGIPTYLAADIAYHKNKFERGFDRVINLWGADHHGYIPRMKAAVEALGYKPEQLEVLILQMVNLFRDGEVVKMSKRTGQSVTLNELVEEVGADAARFFFALRSIDSQLDFDLTLATERSNENPVYYIQYAHARICSIFRQAEEAGVVYQPVPSRETLAVLTDPTEIALIKKLGEYPAEITQAAKERAVHKMAHYVHDLAGLFHAFYNQCRIIGVDEQEQTARLALVGAVRQTLRHVLGILGVTAPERM